ncbi:methyltransferase domain-containing protein [Streptomyces sp. NPDC020096]
MNLDERRAQAADTLAGLGGFHEPWMRDAFARVPRHAFVPDTVWVWRDDAYRPLRAQDEPEAWAELVYDVQQPVVTQVDDGTATDHGTLSTSSISAPNAVFTMLDATDIQPGMKVLEIGTGTGYNAALLCERTGSANVVSVEVDPLLVEAATKRLHAAGCHPRVVWADGEQGWPPEAPYDRIESTAALYLVPFAWVEQTRPGGLIVTPWKSALQPHGLVCLQVSEDGASAAGHFRYPMSFMDLRGQRRPESLLDEIYTAATWEESRDGQTNLDLSFLNDGFHARFALGLKLPGVHAEQRDSADGTSWWLSAKDSWAYVRDGDVYQWGPRDLFTELDQAYQWWMNAGEPDLYRFGMTVDATGQRVWLDDPARSWVI